MPWWKKSLVALAMLLVPLQAGAAAVTALFCHDAPSAIHVLAASADANRIDAAASDSTRHAHPHDGAPQTGGDPHDHTCCGHGLVSLPSLAAVAHVPAAPAWLPAAADSFALFFPEQPHRPPVV